MTVPAETASLPPWPTEPRHVRVLVSWLLDKAHDMEIGRSYLRGELGFDLVGAIEALAASAPSMHEATCPHLLCSSRCLPGNQAPDCARAGEPCECSVVGARATTVWEEPVDTLDQCDPTDLAMACAAAVEKSEVRSGPALASWIRVQTVGGPGEARLAIESMGRRALSALPPDLLLRCAGVVPPLAGFVDALGDVDRHRSTLLGLMAARAGETATAAETSFCPSCMRERDEPPWVLCTKRRWHSTEG